MALQDALTGRTQAPSKSGRDVAFAVGIVTILVMLFLPIPAFLIDLGLAFSIALSVADPDGGAVDPAAARFLGISDRAADRHHAAAVAQRRDHARDPVAWQ
jgi:hypothetical protein